MKGPAVETTEATLAEIKALLDELLECTAECVRLSNPLAKESTAEIKDRWRRETAEQAPACLSSVRAATVHVSVDLTAEDADVIGATPTRCSTTSPRGVAHEAVGCLAADHEEFGVPLSSSETPTMRTPHQMLDGMPLPDNVLTHVGGISLFFELGLEMPSRVEYDTDARQCLTLLLGSRHILFVDGTYDATPPKWPLQEHNKMWQWFGKLPPWGRSGFSPGQDGIKSLYHVFRKWSPWIHSAFWPKRSAIQVSMMFCAKVSSWQRSGFSPGIKGLDGALFVTICIVVVIVGFSADIGAALGDNKEECSLYHGPRWHAEIVYLLGFCLLDFPNNNVQGPARALGGVWLEYATVHMFYKWQPWRRGFSLGTSRLVSLERILLASAHLQLSWHPSGKRHSGLRASRNLRGRECQARLLPNWALSPWALGHPCLGWRASEYIDGRICTEKGIEETELSSSGLHPVVSLSFCSSPFQGHYTLSHVLMAVQSTDTASTSPSYAWGQQGEMCAGAARRSPYTERQRSYMNERRKGGTMCVTNKSNMADPQGQHSGKVVPKEVMSVNEDEDLQVGRRKRKKQDQEGRNRASPARLFKLNATLTHGSEGPYSGVCFGGSAEDWSIINARGPQWVGVAKV